MLITLLLGAAAAYVAPYAETTLKRALAAILLAEAPMNATELRMLSFAVCLFVAALLAGVFSGGSATVLTLGAVLGVFAPRALEKFRARQ